MKEEVSHTGTIVEITPQFTTVRIQSSSACAGCHAAGLCGMGEVAEKAIQVPTDPWSSRRVGDEVEVVLKATMGLKAVWIAYVLPLVILLIIILSLCAVHVPEVYAGLAGIAGIGLYYLVVWLLRDRLNDEYVFTIK